MLDIFIPFTFLFLWVFVLLLRLCYLFHIFAYFALGFVICIVPEECNHAVTLCIEFVSYTIRF